MDFDSLVRVFLERGTCHALKECISYLVKQGHHNLSLFFYEMCSDLYSFDKPLLELAAQSYLSLGETQFSWKIYTDLLTSSTLSPAQLKQYTEGLSKCAQPSYTFYPEQKIKELSSKRPVLPFVTFTITTCKRYDLFERTINSFINCCDDVHLISEWICVDDNSSEMDRALMRQKYPFFKFLMKDHESKGHAVSMNLILDSVQTPFFFHMEDDWEFFRPGRYIQDCLEVLNQNIWFGQCLLNHNYAELPTDQIQGGFPNKTSNGLIYTLHEYQPDAFAFENKYGRVSNCAYWPHYSLRPGLNRTVCLRQVGRYNPSAAHFEMEFSYRYVQLGYKTTFLDWMSCKHIGRLTSERFDETKLNAYVLNNEAQFTKPTPSSYSAYVVNLDRRPDRLETFQAVCPLPVSRFLAIDGKELTSSRRLDQLFEKNDYNYRRGMIGCALSHLSLWVDCSNGTTPYLILEDDVTFVDNFTIKFDHLLTNLPETWDVVFLGHHVFPDFVTDLTYNAYVIPDLTRLSASESLRQSRGGTGGYLVSPQGARHLLEFIQEHSMTNGIDTMMQKACDVCNIYYATPHLIYSACYTLSDPSVDTDIQRDYDSLRRTDDAMLKDELRYFKANGIQYQFDSKVLEGDAVHIHQGPCDTLHPEDYLTYNVGEYHLHVPLTLTLPSFRLRVGTTFSVTDLIQK